MATKVCVTAAAGFIGSCLVKNLLEKGHTVHATCRHPENLVKTTHLLSLPGAEQRLTLFKADLFEPGSFDSAIDGCDFVVNLATSLDITKDPETGFIQPCVEGTVDILRACKKAKTVRRVIHTSSISASFPLNENGEFKDRLDESCWTPLSYIKSTKPNYWMYYVAKTLAEQTAVQFGKDHDIQVVTVAVALVAGPSLTPTISSSILATLSPLTGNRDSYEGLTTFQSLVGCVSLVHVEDVCDAIIFLMEHRDAEGRYICCSEALTLCELTDLLRKLCPEMPLSFVPQEEDEKRSAVPIVSKKLCELGFDYKHGIYEIIEESIGCAKEKQVL